MRSHISVAMKAMTVHLLTHTWLWSHHNCSCNMHIYCVFVWIKGNYSLWLKRFPYKPTAVSFYEQFYDMLINLN